MGRLRLSDCTAATQHRQAAIRQLRDGGLSVRDVAAHLHVSPAVVQHALVKGAAPPGTGG